MQIVRQRPYVKRPVPRSTFALHPEATQRRLRDMPTPEVLSLIAAVLVWIALLATIAPET